MGKSKEKSSQTRIRKSIKRGRRSVWGTCGGGGGRGEIRSVCLCVREEAFRGFGNKMCCFSQRYFCIVRAVVEPTSISQRDDGMPKHGCAVGNNVGKIS